jgi:hypothetical protein
MFTWYAQLVLSIMSTWLRFLPKGRLEKHNNLRVRDLLMLNTSSLNNHTNPIEKYVTQLHSLGQMTLGKSDEWIEEKIAICGVEKIREVLKQIYISADTSNNPRTTITKHAEDYLPFHKEANTPFELKFMFILANAWYQTTDVVVRIILCRDGMKEATSLDQKKLCKLFSPTDLHRWATYTHPIMEATVGSIHDLYGKIRNKESSWVKRLDCTFYEYAMRQSNEFKTRVVDVDFCTPHQ